MTAKNKQIKALTKKWYKKLEKEGFKDIEDAKGNLKSYASSFQYKYKPDVFQSKQRYFELAAQLVHSGYIPNGRELYIWRLHAEGKKVTEISRRLGLSLRLVREVIHDIQRRYIKPQK